MKNLSLLLIIVLLTGCTGIKTVSKNYSKINYRDGVSRSEAKLIAKKSLMESQVVHEYRFASPAILKWGKAFGHPNYWFIAFDSRNVLQPDKYLVVIDKRDGEIRYSEKEYPHPVEPNDYQFIFGLDKKAYKWHAPNES